MADQDIYDEVYKTASKSTTITFDATNYKIDYTSTTGKLKTELTNVIGADVVLNSSVYKSARPTITVAITGTPERVVVSAATMVKNDGVTQDGNAGTVTY